MIHRFFVGSLYQTGGELYKPSLEGADLAVKRALRLAQQFVLAGDAWVQFLA